MSDDLRRFAQSFAPGESMIADSMRGMTPGMFDEMFNPARVAQRLAHFEAVKAQMKKAEEMEKKSELKSKNGKSSEETEKKDEKKESTSIPTCYACAHNLHHIYERTPNCST